MKYKIIRDNYLRIDEQVNEHLGTGWALHGFPYAMGSIIMQAVTFKESTEDKGDKQSKVDHEEITNTEQNPPELFIRAGKAPKQNKLSK